MRSRGAPQGQLMDAVSTGSAGDTGSPRHERFRRSSGAEGVRDRRGPASGATAYARPAARSSPLERKEGHVAARSSRYPYNRSCRHRRCRVRAGRTRPASRPSRPGRSSATQDHPQRNAPQSPRTRPLPVNDDHPPRTVTGRHGPPSSAGPTELPQLDAPARSAPSLRTSSPESVARPQGRSSAAIATNATFSESRSGHPALQATPTICRRA